MSLNDKIIELNDDIGSFINHEKLIASSHFLKFISTLKNFYNLSQHLDEVEEVK